MDVAKKLAGRTWRHFMHDSLYRNSLFIMTSTILTALLGFLFWRINTSLFTPSQIGLATTLISLSGLLINFSLLGINQAIIRTLPNSKDREALINSAMITVGTAATLVAIIFLLLVPLVAPKLSFMLNTPLYAFLFVAFTALSAVNTLTDSIFVALKRAKYIVIENLFLGVTKLVFPFLFIALGAFGIFTAYSGGVIVALLVTFICFIWRMKLHVRFKYHFASIYNIAKYSSMNYVAALLGGVPPLLLPLIITNAISPAQSAYYYMAVMISGMLSIIPQATTNALFAEASHDIDKMRYQAIRATYIILGLMIPAIIFILFFGKYILLFFGSEYSEGGMHILQVLVLGCIPIAIKNVCGTVLKVYGTMKEFVLIEFVTALGILGLSLVLIKPYGIMGVGIAWIISHTVTAALFGLVAWREVTAASRLDAGK